MGYDMDIVVLKKKAFNEMRQLFPNYTYEKLYSNLMSVDYDEKNDWIGKLIASSNRNIFDGFFEPKLKNGEMRIIDRKTYNCMLFWLETKLKGLTLYDCALNTDKDWSYYIEMIEVYRWMKERSVDFENEVVAIESDW